MDMMNTWKDEIAKVLDGEELVYTTLTDEEMNRPFNAGLGIAEGVPFTAWTSTRVIFPVERADGSEGVATVPRDPCTEKTGHVGGE